MENPSTAKKPTVSVQVSAVKVQSDAHGSSSNEAKAPQAHIKPQSSTTNHPAQPVAPAKPVTLAQPATPAQPFALARPVAPAKPVQPVAPAQPVTPVQPVATVQPVMPDEPVEPAQPVSLPVHTIEAAVGQSHDFMSQSAPLTASYNPAVASPNLASVSRYFDSPSNSPNLLPQQPYYEPPKLLAPQQNFAPHPEPKKPVPQTPASKKPEVSPYSAFNVSITEYILFWKR